MPRFVALLVAALLAPAVVAGSTADVMKLVPPDTTVCFVLQDLRGTAGRLADSPFAAAFADSRFGKALLASDEWKQLAAVEKVLTDQLGVTIASLRDDVLGDAVAFAYQPPAGGKDDSDSGVVIGKAADPDALAKLADKLNAAQVKSKELKGTAAKTHAGIGYVERQKANGKAEYYLLRPDGTFAYSVQEAAIRQVIDRLNGTGTVSPLAAAIDQLGLADAVAVLLFEPTAFAADMAAAAKAATDPNQAAFLRQFARLWSAAGAVGLSLTLDRDATLGLSAVFTPNKLPDELRPVLKPADDSSPLWSVVPPDALFAVAGRVEWAGLSAAFQSFLSDDARGGLKQMSADTLAPVLGKDAVPKVAAGVGPDWGLWLTPPAKGDPGPLPAATFVLRVRPAGTTDDAVGQTLLGGLDFAAQLFRVSYNRTHDDQFALVEEKTDGGGVKYLKNDAALPVGVRPAYGLRGDFLVIGSSVEAVTRFTPPKPNAAVKDAPLVRVNAGKLAEYLTTRGGELSELLAGWTGEPAEQVKAELGEFAGVLELFDTLELHHTTDGKRTTVSVRAKTAKPLRK